MQAAAPSSAFLFWPVSRRGSGVRLAFGFLLLASGWSAEAQTASRPEVVAALHDMVQAQALSQAQLGLGAAVAFPDGSVWAEGFGCADVACRLPILPDHRIGFASITKTYTAALVLQLVGEGKLDLDDRLGTYIGPYTHVNAGITIRQLLGHQSGVYNMTDHPNLEASVWSDLDRRWTPESILSEFVNPPIFFAGSGARYSNTNYVLLQLVIEAVTGRTYLEELRARLLNPLGLTETFFGPDEPVTGPIPRTWVDLNGDGTLEDFTDRNAAVSVRTIRGASGGMIATTSDIAKWAQALFDGPVLEASQRAEMLQFHALDGVGPIWTGYGLGIQRYDISGEVMWGHSGLIRGATSLMLFHPDLGYSIALVDNDARSAHRRTAADIVQYLATLDLTSTRSELPHAGEESPSIRVFPNPASAGSIVTIRIPARSRGAAPTIQLVDVLGRVHRTVSSGGAGRKSMTLTGIPPGVYFVRVLGSGRAPVARLLAIR